MNAQIGKNVNKKINLHNSLNRYGKHLTGFILENRWTWLNSNFQKRKGKWWVYTNAYNANVRRDYILINKKWNNSVLNCEAYSSFECVSCNQQIVTAEIRQCLRRNEARTTSTVHDDWSLINNRDIRDKYTSTLRNKSNGLQKMPETRNPND